MRDPVRVVIADDHPMFLFGLRSALAGVGELEIVGEAVDAAELARVVDVTRPSVVLTDLSMPGTEGTTSIRSLIKARPEMAVLVLTMHADDEAIFGALRAGARGYLLKGAERDEIVRAVLTVDAGGSVFGGQVGQRITHQLSQGAATQTGKVFSSLTDREHEILEHVATGRSNHEIAALLHLSEKTVRNQVAMVLTKLQVRDRAAAVATARDRGLGNLR